MFSDGYEVHNMSRCTISKEFPRDYNFPDHRKLVSYTDSLHRINFHHLVMWICPYAYFQYCYRPFCLYLSCNWMLLTFPLAVTIACIATQ